MHLVAKTELDREIAERVTPTARELGLDLVRVRSHDSKEPRVQIMAERREGSIDLDDCARLSRAVRPALDALFPGRDPALEVSSPGLDRPLTRLEDFSAFAGSAIRVEIQAPQSGRRRFRGTLLGVRDEVPDREAGPWIEIRDDEAGGTLLRFSSLASARLEPFAGTGGRRPAARKHRKH